MGVEEAPRLVAGAVEDLGRVQGRGDGRDRVDERLEERRLRLELVFGELVAPALGDDQVQREGAEERGRGDEAAGCDGRLTEGEPERADERGPDGAADEDAASVTGEATVHRQPPVVRSVDDRFPQRDGDGMGACPPQASREYAARGSSPSPG